MWQMITLTRSSHLSRKLVVKIDTFNFSIITSYKRPLFSKINESIMYIKLNHFSRANGEDEEKIKLDLKILVQLFLGFLSLCGFKDSRKKISSFPILIGKRKDRNKFYVGR